MKRKGLKIPYIRNIVGSNPTRTTNFITIMATKNNIVKVWGANTSKTSFAAKEQKETAARRRLFGVKSRAQRSDAGKKRK